MNSKGNGFGFEPWRGRHHRSHYITIDDKFVKTARINVTKTQPVNYINLSNLVLIPVLKETIKYANKRTISKSIPQRSFKSWKLPNLSEPKGEDVEQNKQGRPAYLGWYNFRETKHKDKQWSALWLCSQIKTWSSARGTEPTTFNSQFGILALHHWTSASRRLHKIKMANYLW